MDFINSIVSQKDSRIIALLGADCRLVSLLVSPTCTLHAFTLTTFATTWAPFLPPRGANWSPEIGYFLGREKKPSIPFAQLCPCTGCTGVPCLGISYPWAPMPRTYLGALHMGCGTGYLGMGVWVWTAGGRRPCLGVNAFGRRFSCTHALVLTVWVARCRWHGATGALVLPHGCATCAAHMPRMGCAIAISCVVATHFSSIADFARRSGRYSSYIVLGLRWF